VVSSSEPLLRLVPPKEPMTVPVGSDL
jgi:hypothetical protein